MAARDSALPIPSLGDRPLEQNLCGAPIRTGLPARETYGTLTLQRAYIYKPEACFSPIWELFILFERRDFYGVVLSLCVNDLQINANRGGELDRAIRVGKQKEPCVGQASLPPCAINLLIPVQRWKQGDI